MTTFETIVFSDDEAPVARVTLNRPEKRNALSGDVCEELLRCFHLIRERDDIVAVVLSGAGPVFSAGGDLSLLGSAGAGNAPVSVGKAMSELLATMHELGKPIIAMVGGDALAGGLGLMVACDLVVASSSAGFGLPEIRVGLWPMLITAELTRNIGRKKTLELMLTGRRIDAAEAATLGLVNRVVDPAELEETTLRLARRIAGMSPAAMRLGLRAFYGSQDLSHEQALGVLSDGLDEILALEDAREGIAAFLAKRKPEWRGR